jgi:hypothetical protein
MGPINRKELLGVRARFVSNEVAGTRKIFILNTDGCHPSKAVAFDDE